MATTNGNPAAPSALESQTQEPAAPTSQDGAGAGESRAAAIEPGPERLPTRKDITLREFLGKMDDYAPIVCYSDSPGPLRFLTSLTPTHLPHHP